MSTEKKPDFSNVQSGSGSTEQSKPDFSNVKSGASSTEEIVGGMADTHLHGREGRHALAHRQGPLRQGEQVEGDLRRQPRSAQ